MTDMAKVIKGLECSLGVRGLKKCDDCPYDNDFNCLGCDIVMRDALELLKEQEPKPVIVTTNAYGTRFYHCPRCNRDLYIYPRQLYCSNCGQAVKWDDMGRL